MFVIYGSLIPFEFRSLTLGEGWEQFGRARYLNLGVQSRADWVANIVLYIPLAFLGVTWAHRKMPTYAVSFLRVMLVLVACVLIAFGLEFVQVFVKPRTVSVNDLIAEAIGSCIGITLWYLGRARLVQGLTSLSGDGTKAVTAALWFYLVFYLALALFPYDFVISIREYSWKLATDRVHLFLAPAGCAEVLRCLARLAAETIAVIPVGILIALRRGDTCSLLKRAFAYGCLLGLFIELAQLLMASGVSQGVSVLSRGLGSMIGAKLCQWQRTGGLSHSAPAFSNLAVLSTVPYIVLLMALNGWFTAPWAGLGEALAGLEVKNFLPFYYHYFTSEATAMDSLLANAGMYAPFGLVYWLWILGRAHGGSAITPALLAAFVALAIESGKLFVVGKHADPTNVLVAAMAAALTYSIAAWISRKNSPQEARETGSIEERSYTAAVGPVTVSRKPLSWLLGLCISTLVVWIVLQYPVGAIWLFSCLAVYAILLWQRPRLWLFMVPALLPVFDFATWTGWYFLTEYDLLLAVTVAVLVVREEGGVTELKLSQPIAWLLSAFGVIYGISLLIGLLPLQPLDHNAFASYYSHYNALRVGKGVVWAFLLLPFLRNALQTKDELERYLVPGVLTGLAMTVLAILYERWAFPGLFNLSSDFRATAFFSSMHLGGASVDGYLALVMPFVALCFLLWRNALSYATGMILYALGLYAFLVTFSRINYIAIGMSTLVILVGLVRDRTLGHRYFKVALPLVAVTALISVPLFLAPYTMVRFATVGEDAASRHEHWKNALALRDTGPAAQLFGMGVGSFPRVFFWTDPGPSRPASFAYVSEDGNDFLRLGSGKPLYILQRIRPAQNEQHQVSLNLRAAESARGLSVMICEKPLLYSQRCESIVFGVVPEEQAWLKKHAIVSLSDYGKAGRSVYLVLYNPNAGTVVDIDGISVRGVDGDELVANGEFSRGSERWFFTSDDHRSWRVDNLWIHILFEQGWLGMVTFGLLLAVTLTRLGRGAWHGDSLSLVLLASLVGGLTVGLVDNIVEAPRLTLLLFLLLFVSLYHAEMRGRGIHES